MGTNKKLNWWKDKMAVFNWTYFSFTDIDTTWLYREMVLIPILIFFLWVFWMKVVRNRPIVYCFNENLRLSCFSECGHFYNFSHKLELSKIKKLERVKS